MHHFVQALDPYRHHVGTGLTFEDQPRYAPFEVAHCRGWVLVDPAFGEDVQPGVLAGGVVGGGGVGVFAGGGVGCGGGGGGVGERVGEVVGRFV